MKIFSESFRELNQDKAIERAKAFNAIYKVNVSVFRDTNNRYLIIPKPDEHPNRFVHLYLEEIFSI